MPPSTGRLVVPGKDQFEAALLEVLVQCSAGSYCSIGESSAALLNTCLQQQGEQTAHQEYSSFKFWSQAEKIREVAQVAFICVEATSRNNHDAPEQSTDNSQLAYLGGLCRQYPHGVIVVQYRASSGLRQKYFAAGFTEAVYWDDSAGPAAVYVYRLSHYKSQPSWLNSKYWANPERFDMPPE